MYCAAAELDAAFERLLLCAGSWKRRQHRRMNIQNTVGKCFEKDAAQNTHESGKHHERHIMLLQNFDGRAVEVFARVLPRGNVDTSYSARPCPIQARRG